MQISTKTKMRESAKDVGVVDAWEKAREARLRTSRREEEEAVAKRPAGSVAEGSREGRDAKETKGVCERKKKNKKTGGMQSEGGGRVRLRRVEKSNQSR